METTIAAISTAIGEGGIAIIRMSGPLSLQIADRFFVSRKGKPSEFLSHTIHYGTIGCNGDLVDQVMLTVLRAPHTYTGEDTVEINCHGGLLTAKKILSLCLEHGAQAAEPGEYTKRAFLNGRIDLTQAEAVMDLVRAKTDRAHTVAAHALEGHLTAKINNARDRIVNVLAHIEAHIDFPDDDIEPDTYNKLITEIKSITTFVKILLATYNDCKVLRDGVTVVIIGRPNVGKSSLMNALIGRNRSIVTSIPGTTRDSIEEVASIRGIAVRLTDTAGIRKARGKVEKLGIECARNSLHISDLVFHLIDISRPFSPADARLALEYNGKSAIIVLTKKDLHRKLRLPLEFHCQRVVEISVVTGDGLELLKDETERLVLSSTLLSREHDVSINERHADALRRVIESLLETISEIDDGASLEIISQQLHTGLDALGEIVGKTTTDDILDRVFSSFCIGK